jgi:hypothetical protein
MIFSHPRGRAPGQIGGNLLPEQAATDHWQLDTAAVGSMPRSTLRLIRRFQGLCQIGKK